MFVHLGCYHYFLDIFSLGQTCIYIFLRESCNNLTIHKTIPQHPSMFTTVQISTQDVDERLLNFSYHLVKSKEMISKPSGCVIGYMEWYFRISHPFVLSVNKECIPIVQPVIPDMRDVLNSSTQHNLVYVSDYGINVYSTF